MSLDYVWEKFYAAVLTLAAGSGDVRDRLASAYVGSLIRLEAEEVPEEIRDKFRAFVDALTRVKAKGQEGDAAASAAALGEVEASRLAESVVEMYEEVVKHGPSGELGQPTPPAPYGVKMQVGRKKPQRAPGANDDL